MDNIDKLLDEVEKYKGNTTSTSNTEENIGQSAARSKVDYKPNDQIYTSTLPAGVLFHRSPLAKIGLAIIALAICGLIVSNFVPWVYTQSGSDSMVLGHDFRDEDGNIMGSSSGYGYFNDAYSYILGSPSMADGGFVFLIILGIAAMFLGMVRVSLNYKNTLFSFFAFIIGALAIIPSLWIIISGVRFIGFNVLSIFNTQGMFFGAEGVFPAAYIMLIFGIIFMILAFKIIKREGRLLDKNIQDKSNFQQRSNATGG